MKRIVIYSAGLLLAGTAVAYSGPIAAQGDYPPCSATITDRCIQLYEPGVATPANLALNDQLGDGTQLAQADYPEATEVAYSDYDNEAVGGPYEPVDGYEAAAYEEPAADEYASAWAADDTAYYPEEYAADYGAY
jgi:hypothetical protein